MMIAVMTAWTIARHRAKDFGFTEEFVTHLMFFEFLVGLAGARIFYVLQHFENYRGDWARAFNIYEGGLVWYGGFLAAVGLGLLMALWKRWPVWKLFDFFAPVVAVVQAIGRIGCFLNGCCPGKESIPIQLYSSAALFGLAAFLFWFSKRKHVDGDVFLAYLGIYSVLRFFTEFFRVNDAVALDLSLPQWISLILFFTAFLWKILRSRSRS